MTIAGLHPFARAHGLVKPNVALTGDGGLLTKDTVVAVDVANFFYAGGYLAFGRVDPMAAQPSELAKMMRFLVNRVRPLLVMGVNVKVGARATATATRRLSSPRHPPLRDPGAVCVRRLGVPGQVRQPCRRR